MFLANSNVALVRMPELSAYPVSPVSSTGAAESPIPRLLDSLFRDAGYGGGAPRSTGSAEPFIRPGDTVVLKPNWVMHRNASGHNLDCLVTHPSVIAAVLEKVLQANPRRVIVGDAPVQGCNLPQLMEDGGYNRLKEHFARIGAPVDWVDFRRTTLDRSSALWKQATDLRPQERYALFDLKEESLLEPVSAGSDRFRVTVYNPDLMRQRHAPGKHQYLVAREILEADVVINLPKLKMHGKAGITGALKNVIGINGNKEFLPHHRLGGTDNGGDCYAGGSRLKLVGEHFLDAANRRSGAANLAIRQFSRVSFRLARALGEDRNTEGAWHGNDTIWRTCLDLNRVLVYGRPDATLAPSPQRRVLTVTDAIVCGEGEGPLAPTPRPLGILTCAENPVAAEYVHAHLMGLDWQKVPVIREAFGSFAYPLATFQPEDVTVISNGQALKQPWPAWNDVPLRPPVGWQGHCERQ